MHLGKTNTESVEPGSSETTFRRKKIIFRTQNSKINLRFVYHSFQTRKLSFNQNIKTILFDIIIIHTENKKQIMNGSGCTDMQHLIIRICILYLNSFCSYLFSLICTDTFHSKLLLISVSMYTGQYDQFYFYG